MCEGNNAVYERHLQFVDHIPFTATNLPLIANMYFVFDLYSNWMFVVLKCLCCCLHPSDKFEKRFLRYEKQRQKIPCHLEKTINFRSAVKEVVRPLLAQTYDNVSESGIFFLHYIRFGYGSGGNCSCELLV